ncbi:DUF1285 domain-containing protein [Terrarubrum flagellatum]|uniref:DUF1285 domain-containing protein n=1 Tax=Terrirubrum flagellatum TaxID=2895980 RepID=UPI003144F510
MIEAAPTPQSRLAALSHAAGEAKKRGLPPVHMWNPPFCGDIDMRIAADGQWFYMGSPIGRPAMVRLFSTILRKDPERYVMVTPVERVGVTVDDLPFVAVEMSHEGDGEGQRLTFRTNVDDETIAGPDRPLRFDRAEDGGLKPAVLVRDALWARLSRPLLYDLVELGVEKEVDGARQFGVWSGAMFFPICPAAEIDHL